MSQPCTYELAHGGCRFLLGGGGDVSVGPEREAHIKVPQHARHRPNIHAVLQRRCGEGVAQIMEPNVLDARPLQDLVMEPRDGVRVVHPARHRRGEHVRLQPGFRP